MPKNDSTVISDWLKKNVITEDTLKLTTSRREPEKATIELDLDWDVVADRLFDEVIARMLETAKNEGIDEGREE